tara:strand:+ start:19376 stop:19708 length:333 start_codon:yes stop_codon:yes gene_type:complete
MDLLQLALTDIWGSLNENFNWIIFIMVIAVGYGVRLTPIGKGIPLSLRIFMVTAILGGFYAFYESVEPGVFIASYFTPLGLHSFFIKYLERRLGFSSSRTVGGSLPPGDD